MRCVESVTVCQQKAIKIEGDVKTLNGKITNTFIDSMINGRRAKQTGNNEMEAVKQVTTNQVFKTEWYEEIDSSQTQNYVR